MKKFILDLYIIKKFLGTFFFIMILLMSIAVIFDVSEKIEDFVNRDAPIDAILFDYYLNFVAHYGNLFSSMIIFIAVIFFTSKMAQNTEIVAIISSGVSFNRLLVPYFIAATILAAMSLYLNHQVLPRANLERLEFEELYIKNPFKIAEENMHREVEPGTIIYFRNYLSTKYLARHFSVEKWNGKRLKWKLTAVSATYNPDDSTWKCQNFFVRDYGENFDRIRHGSELDTAFGFTPAAFAQRLSVASAMGYDELNDYIEKETAKGSDKVVFFEIEKHQRTSYPLATYVLTLIGVTIASRKRRGGIGVHLAMGIGIVMIYIFCMKVTTVAATNAGLDPLLAVWIPNFIFLGIGLFIYRLAQK